MARPARAATSVVLALLALGATSPYGVAPATPAASPTQVQPVRAALVGVRASDPRRPVSMGRASSWTPMDAASTKANPSRWDTCTPVVWRVDFTGLTHQHGRPALEVDRLRSAFATIGQESGVRFVYGGRARLHPSADGSGGVDTSPGTDIAISYAAQRDRSGYRSPLFTGTYGVLGVGGAWSRRAATVGGTTGFRRSTGSLLMNALYTVHYQNPRAARREHAAGDPLRSVYLHELGHVMGLDHVTHDRMQIMYPQLQRDVPDRFGAGDLAGLHRMRTLPCFVPDAVPAPSAP